MSAQKENYIMIKVEGYKAFRGEMIITPLVSTIKPFTVSGDWLYKPDTKCWYCGGRSYPQEVCSVLSDKTV